MSFYIVVKCLRTSWSRVWLRHWSVLSPLHVLDVTSVSRWSSVLSDLRLLITQFIAALDSSLLDVKHWKNKRLSTLCDREHLLCLVKYLQQRGGRGSGLGGAASDLFWSANNLSEDKVADPPMLGSLLLEGIWSWFFPLCSEGRGPWITEWGEIQRNGGGGVYSSF